MTTPNHATIETPPAQRLADFRLRTLPIIVWVGCAVVAAAMLIGRAARLDYVGLAQANEYPIAPMATGTVDRVVVDLYDRVRAGEMVAKLDDSLVLAAMATANASLVQLQAEFEAARAKLITDEGRGLASWEADRRRFIVDEEQRRLDLLALKIQIESGEIELERLDLESRRSRELWEAGVVSRETYDVARLESDELRKSLEESRLLFAQTEEEYLSAKERRAGYENEFAANGVLEALLEPLREAIEVENRRLDEIELQRQTLVLRSPVDGQVSQILCRRGKAVVAGEAVVVVAEDSVREIVAFLAEDDSRPVAPSTPVMVSTRGAEGTVSESVVLRVGPIVQQMPQRLWRDPRVPDYGRAVVIAAAPGMRLTPGEQVNVKFLPLR